MIQKHSTWDIHDATKIQRFMDCARQYMYEFVLGWTPEGKSNHLVFGDAVHKALDVLYTHGLDEDFISEAYTAFINTYRKDFSPETDTFYGGKTPANVGLYALPEYIQEYTGDKEFELLHTEVAGSVPFSDKYKVHFKIDAILKGDEGYFSLEHKTGSRISRQWTDKWQLSTQVGLYYHAMNMLYGPENVHGIIVNGIFFKKGSVEFMRVPVRKTSESMFQWYWNTHHWLDMIHWEFERLKECETKDEPILMAFPMNTESCSKYFGCPYMDFCISWKNPLHKCDSIPIGFEEKRWNPMDREDGAKWIIEGEEVKKKEVQIGTTE